MSAMRNVSLLVLVLIFIAVGCSDVQTRQYQVMVYNNSSKPVTVWLTKNGEMYEETWKAPEDYAIESPKARAPVTGKVIDAHDHLGTPVLPGKFRPETDAILRIYPGQFTFNEILAANSKNGGRKDVVLQPGYNEVTISETGIDQTHRPLPAK
jgi:hypothetical protein